MNPKKLIVFDIDGTITTHKNSWQFIHEHLNIWKAQAYKYQEQFLRGKISYERFCALDAVHWRGIRLRTIYREFEKIPLTKGSIPLIRTLNRRDGIVLAAISTGLQFMPMRLGKLVALRHAYSNALIVRRGILTGGVKINVPIHGKGTLLKKIQKKLNISKRHTVVIGDGDGDIPMIGHSDFSIAFNAHRSRFQRLADYCCVSNDFAEIGLAIDSWLRR